MDGVVGIGGLRLDLDCGLLLEFFLTGESHRS